MIMLIIDYPKRKFQIRFFESLDLCLHYVMPLDTDDLKRRKRELYNIVNLGLNEWDSIIRA